MDALLSELEKEQFAKVLEVQALSENAKWYIDGEGPIYDMMEIVNALFEGKHIHLQHNL